jgi:hypothetical protein
MPTEPTCGICSSGLGACRGLWLWPPAYQGSPQVRLQTLRSAASQRYRRNSRSSCRCPLGTFLISESR